MQQSTDQNLKLGILQTQSVDSLKTNVAKILEVLNNQDLKDLDMVCLPENTLYMRLSAQDNFQGISLDDPDLQPLQMFVNQNELDILVGGSPVRLQDRIHNSILHFKPESSLEVLYNKIHMFDVQVKGDKPYRESDFFTPGQNSKVWEFRDWRWGLSICYDMRFAELYSKYAKKFVDLIFIPSSFTVPTGQAHWHVLLRARAIESQAFVLAPAQAGVHKSEQFEGKTRSTYGHSLLVSPWGEVLMDAQDKPWSFHKTQLDSSALLKVREQIPQASHRRL